MPKTNAKAYHTTYSVENYIYTMQPPTSSCIHSTAYTIHHTHHIPRGRQSPVDSMRGQGVSRGIHTTHCDHKLRVMDIFRRRFQWLVMRGQNLNGIP
ncbi:hypothetical protein EON63_19315 [archaeon]|nr:MAG: hypothetical protein EON63_19315 [archaeon]